ncbi:MAG: HAD family hydrolase [Halodesulfurarchaeum sp.]
MGYDALLLDNDGVITEVTDRAMLRRAVVEAFRDMGVPDPAGEDVDSLVVGVTPERLERVCSTYDIGPGPFWQRRDRRSWLVQARELRAGRKPLYDDVTAVLDRPLPVGVVSSNQHATVAAILEHYGLGGSVDTFYGREMTVESLERKKPSPHYLERAAADLGATAPLMVGDSEADIRAADRAGMDSVFVRRPHRSDAALTVTPTYEVGSLSAVSDILDDGGP